MQPVGVYGLEEAPDRLGAPGLHLVGLAWLRLRVAREA
jgi:hypothetical protein